MPLSNLTKSIIFPYYYPTFSLTLKYPRQFQKYIITDYSCFVKLESSYGLLIVWIMSPFYLTVSPPHSNTFHAIAMLEKLFVFFDPIECCNFYICLIVSFDINFSSLSYKLFVIYGGVIRFRHIIQQEYFLDECFQLLFEVSLKPQSVIFLHF